MSTEKNVNKATQLIKGKRCVVVASSGYLRGRGSVSRDFIESFDLVVKSSDMCEIPDNYGELGRRCDIWYGLPKVPSWEMDISAVVKQNVKMMMLQPCMESYKDIWLKCEKWLEGQNLSIETSIADSDNYHSLKNTLGCMPFSGLFAISDLLYQGASEVYAYGHDFFESGYFKDSEIYDVIDSGWHLLEPQMQYMWFLLQNEPRFKCDENLADILKRKFSNIDENEQFHRMVNIELTHFNQLQPFTNALIFRSFRADKFSLFFDAMVKQQCNSPVTVVTQHDFDAPYMNSAIQLKIAPQQKFNAQSICELLYRRDTKFHSCFVPYNGLQLHSYLDLFKAIVELEIEVIHLVGLRGNIKRIDNLSYIIREIEHYLELRREFRCLQDKYDRKKAF